MSGSRRAHTPRTPNPDTSTGTDHVRGHITIRPPTTKHGPTKHGHRREMDTQSHGHTKAQAEASPRTEIHKDPQTRDARVCTKTPEAPAHAHGPGQSLCLLEALSPWSSYSTPAEPRAPRGRCRCPESSKS